MHYICVNTLERVFPCPIKKKGGLYNYWRNKSKSLWNKNEDCIINK